MTRVAHPSKIKEKIIPLVSNIILAVINFYCLAIYYVEVTDKNLVDLGHVAYLTMLSHGLIGLTKFFNDETFIDLRILLDYAQIVLPHPFLTTVLWQKHDVGANEVALMHCFFGLAAFLFFAIMEYKRQDLTDLALITSITSSVIVGILYENYFASLGGMLLAISYFMLKRGEECMLQSTNATAGVFNLSMATYSLITLAQFEPKSWILVF